MIRPGRLQRYAACLSLCLFAGMSHAQDRVLRPKLQTAHQQIVGFGASDAWIINPAVKAWISQGRNDSVETLADLLFNTDKGIGLSAWRFNIGAGSAEQGESSRIPDKYRRAELFIPAPGAAVDQSKQSGQVQFLQAAHQRGVNTLVAFANSPPHWATRNGLTHPADGDGVGSSNLAPERVDEYSRFLVRVLSFLRGEDVNVPINYISPANEPTWHWEDQTQEGNRYNNLDLKRLYRSLYRELDAAGLAHEVEIDGPEVPEYRAALGDQQHGELFGKIYREGMNKTTYGEYKNYIEEFAGDEEMQAILGNKVSLHAYFSEANALHLGPLRDALRNDLALISPEPQVWMSEYCVLGGPGDVRDFDGHGFEANDYHLAEHVARIIHRDLSRLNVTAWFWWLALTPYDYKDGLVKISPDLSPDSLEPSKVMWVLGQFSRFIRPGYQRVSLPGFDDLHGLMASAYRSPNLEKLVVVIVNASDEDTTLGVDIEEMPAGYQAGTPLAFMTNASTNLALTPKLLLSEDKLTIPEHSVVTLDIPLVQGDH